MPILIRGSGGKVQKMQEGSASATNKVSTDSKNYCDYLKITFPFLGNISFQPRVSPRLSGNKGVVVCGGLLLSSIFSVDAMYHDDTIGAYMAGTSFSFTNEDDFLTAVKTGDSLTLQCKTDADCYFASEYTYVTWSD